MKIKRKVSILLIFAMFVSLFSGVGTLKVEAAEIKVPTWMETYPKASYEMTSPNFTMKVGGMEVPVVHYYYKENVREGYSYAHLAYEGTATFEITSLKGNIEAVDASPHSYNMDVKIDGNKFTFDLEQKQSRYMVFDVRASGGSYQLIVSADPDLKLEVPVVDGKTVISAKDGVPEIGVGGLSSSDKASEGKNNTAKIQKIITWLSENGGGTLYFPAGVYSFVTIDATSNVTLYLDAGAVLRGSGIRTDYDWNTTGQNGIQAKKRDIRIENVKNFKIIGKGMIDANSIAVSQKGKTSSGSRELNNDPQPADWYPDGWNDYRKGIVDGSNSDGVEFRGVTFKDATGWTFNIRSTKNIEMHNVKMLDDYTVVHSDGYDIVSCQNVNVMNCFGVCGDDVFCPKGDISGTVMENYLFKDCVAYAEGGAGCKIGVQARSDVKNIEFNNIDVIRGYRGFTIAHDEGNGNWDGIRFINIRTEKLHIPSFSTSSADNYGQYTATPFSLWLLSNGSVKNVEVTNCSFESISNLRAMIKGKSDDGKISNVTFTNLTMDGRTVTSLDDPRISVGSYVDADSFKFNNTEVHTPTTTVYEAENAVLENGAKTTKEDKTGKYSAEYKVSHLGIQDDGKEGTATFTVEADKAGEYDLEIYGITKKTRAFYVTVNNGTPQMVNCNGDGWTLQGRTTTKVQLNAGQNRIKLGNPYAAAPDLDKIEIIKGGTIYNPNAASKASSIIANQPVLMEVENDLLTLAGSAKYNDSGLIGYVGGTGNGTVTFQVQAAEAGEHVLKLNYATLQERSVSVKVNNNDPVTATCTPTGDWNTVGTTPKEIIVNLDAGVNTITIGGVNGGDAPNIERITISLDNSDAQATVAGWIDAIPENVTAADKAYVDAVKKAYDNLAVKNEITNAGKIEEALEAVEGRSFLALSGEIAETSGAAIIVSNPENPADYHIGNIGGPNQGAVTFHAQADEAGERTLRIYYSTIGARSLNVAVNDGAAVTLNAPSTGSWDEPGETPLTLKVNLKEGDNTITLSGDGDNWAPNIDRIELALTNQEVKETVQAIINSLPDADEFAAADEETYEKLMIKVESVNTLYENMEDKADVNVEKLETAQESLEGKDSADAVIAAISAIGTVTLNSKESIDTAKAAYEALTETQKKLVTNYNDLVEAEAAYTTLKQEFDDAEEAENKAAADKIAADAVIESINNLAEVGLEDGDRIAAAKAAYDALTDDQKLLVTNYQTLQAAENQYNQLVEEEAEKKEQEEAQKEANQEAANAVIELISGIGTVTLNSEETISAAKAAYDDLTDEQKKLVTNYDALQKAEADLEQQKADAEQAEQDAIEAEKKKAEDKEKADAVTAAIYSIGTVTLESEELIKAAREAYEALTDDQKGYVTNYEALVEAENQYNQLANQTPGTGDNEGSQSPETGNNGGSQTPETGNNGGSQSPETGNNGESQSPETGNNGGSQTSETGNNGGSQSPETGNNAGTQTPETGNNAGTQNPGTGDNTGNSGNTESPSVVSKGDIYKYKKIKYKVTKADMTGKGTVEVVAPEKKNVKTVVIPATIKIEGATFKVTSIGKNAFKKCSKLKKITIKTKNLKKVGKNAFKGIKSNAKIKVPSSKLKKYKKLLKGKGQGKKVTITK